MKMAELQNTGIVKMLNDYRYYDIWENTSYHSVHAWRITKLKNML